MKVNGSGNSQSFSSSEGLVQKNLEGVNEILAGTIKGSLKQASEDTKKKTKKILLIVEEEFEKLEDEPEDDKDNGHDDEQ
ncbi:hypothetical protein HOG98_01695 [bacterium]|jgi:hypothetical protein|nr:hypothetical protein [bacterium]